MCLISYLCVIISPEHLTTLIKMKNQMMKAEATLTKRGLVHQCRNCVYRGDRGQMEGHVVSLHLDEDAVPFKCGLCRKRFVTLKQTDSHVLEKHSAERDQQLVLGTKLPLGDLSAFATTLSKAQSLAHYSQRARSSGKRDSTQDQEIVVIIEDGDVPTAAVAPKESLKTKAGPQPQELLTSMLQYFQGNPEIAMQMQQLLGGEQPIPQQPADNQPGADIALASTSSATDPESTGFTASNYEGENPERCGTELAEGQVTEDAAKDAADIIDQSLKEDLALSDTDSSSVVDPDEKQVARILHVQTSDDERDQPLEDGEGPRRVLYLPAGHATFSEGETFIECQSSSNTTSGAVPVSELAEFINSTVRATIESVASAIVTAARNQPAPASANLAGIGLQLQETNVNMANMTAAVGKCANSMASNNIAEHTLEACNKLTVTSDKLEGAVEKLNSTCTRLANSVDQLTEAIQAQAGAQRTLVHGLIQSQQDVANQMNWQGSQFRAVHSQFAGLIEDERRGGQTTALVRHILNVHP